MILFCFIKGMIEINRNNVFFCTNKENDGNKFEWFLYNDYS